MSGGRIATQPLLAALLLLNQCGGLVKGDAPGAGTGNGAGTGGMTNAPDECVGGAPDDGGCGGEASDALSEYARLRTSCTLRTEVNRAGAPASICYRLR